MRRLAILAALAVATTARAQPAEPERLYLDGQRAYDDKRYDDALLLWKRSYDMSRLPALLFNIAQAYRLRAHPGDCTIAVERYRKFIELDPKSPRRATAEGLIRELEPCATAEAQHDKLAPAPPAPVVIAPAPAPAPVMPPLRDRDPGAGKRIAAYVAAGGGVALAVTGVYFGAKARSLGDEVTAACAHGCDWSTVAGKDAEGRSDERKQWLFYGLGAAALASGGVLYWLGTREHPTSPVAVVPRGDGALVTWSGAW